MRTADVLAEGRARLAAAGTENPSLDASLLLAEALGKSRAAVIAGAGCVGAESLAAFDGFLRRRIAGECVAYILGRKEFRGLDFAVNESVLVPRPDTEILVEAAVEWLDGERGAGEGGAPRVLDLCTGSGAVAVAVKNEVPAAEVWATDVCPAALAVAAGNAERLLEGRSAIRFLRGDLLRAVPAGTVFDLIVGNPPYVPAGEIGGLSREVRGEPRLALDGGEDGLDLIRTIVAGARGLLRPGGALMVEADPRQMGAIAALMEKAGFADIGVSADLGGLERVIAGTKPLS